jgi:predicted permease
METTLKDFRHAFRGLLRRPGFAAMVVLSLALGIGANTAIFSVVSALLFRPLPYPESERLVAVSFENGKLNGYQFWPYPKFVAFRDNQSSLESVAAYEQLQLTMTVNQPKRVEAEIVTPNYFSLLGVKPALGNLFPVSEISAQPALLIDYRMWQRDFGGDTQIVGRSLLMNREPFVIAGVLPPEFRGQSGTVECWVPMETADRLKFKSALTSNAVWWLKVIGRMKQGVSRTQANAEMEMVSDRVAKLAPAQTASMLTSTGQELIKLNALKDTKIDPVIRKSFLILQAVVAVLLAIACANTANLLLGRSISRQKEFAVRLAIGGSRMRLARLVLSESILLALIGGCAAVLIATWIVQWMTTVRPLNTVGFWSQYAQTFDYFSVKLDWPLLTFNFALTLFVGILCGLIPAWRACRPGLNDLLKREVQRTGAGLRSLRRLSIRGGLVVTEIALSLVLLAGAGLLLTSFARLSVVKIGFEPKDVFTTTVGVDRQPVRFYERLSERLRNLPGVEKASLSLVTPLSGDHPGGTIQIEGQPSDGSVKTQIDFNVVTPEYFETLSIPVLKGRVFTDGDRTDTRRVAVITREAASRYWPAQDPLGKRIKTPFRDAYGEQNSWIEIVGVVDDVKYGGVDEPAEPTLYLPSWQPLGTPEAVSLSPASISIRSSLPPAALFALIQREVRELDLSAPLYGTTTMNDRAAQVTSRYRHSALFVTLFACVAVGLSAIGIYGVISYTVSASTHEVGVRMALGAQPSEIVRLVIANGLFIILVSLCAGLPVAYAATRVLSTQLYETSTTDPRTFIVVTLLSTLIALVGCVVPAVRAARIDPVSSLREV